MLLIFWLISSCLAFSACSRTKTICVYTTLTDDKQSVLVTVHSQMNGWAAIGLGTSIMPGSDMYIGWKNSSGGYTVSQRTGNDASAPSIRSKQQFTIVPLAVTADSSVKLAFSFIRPRSSDAYTIQEGQVFDFIFAASNSVPSSPDSDSSTFSIHDLTGTARGAVTANNSDLITVSDSTPILDNLSIQYVSKVHGIIMFIAWGIAPYVGIFIARYLKDALGVWWYRLHVGIMLGVTGCGTLIGIVLMYLYAYKPHFSKSAHQVIGLLIGIAMVLQIILGFISNAKWSPTRTSIPWWDKLHWWLGRIVFIFALINIFLGLRLYGNSAVYIALFAVSIVLGIAVLIIGHFKIGQVHHVQKPAQNIPPFEFKSVVASNSDSPESSPNLYQTFTRNHTQPLNDYPMIPSRKKSLKSVDDVKSPKQENEFQSTDLFKSMDRVFQNSPFEIKTADTSQISRSPISPSETIDYPVIPQRKKSLKKIDTRTHNEFQVRIIKSPGS